MLKKSLFHLKAGKLFTAKHFSGFYHNKKGFNVLGTFKGK